MRSGGPSRPARFHFIGCHFRSSISIAVARAGCTNHLFSISRSDGLHFSAFATMPSVSSVTLARLPDSISLHRVTTIFARLATWACVKFNSARMRRIFATSSFNMGEDSNAIGAMRTVYARKRIKGNK